MSSPARGTALLLVHVVNDLAFEGSDSSSLLRGQPALDRVSASDVASAAAQGYDDAQPIRSMP